MPRETAGFKPRDVTMPQLGMAQDAGRIVSWLRAPGDAVKQGDALFEVETDKATMEVEAQADGYLTAVSAAEGDDVPVGAVIATISDTPEGVTAPAPASALPDGMEVTMPQLGMAQDSGVLMNWLKELGAEISKGDPLFEVETDKATQEVEAPASGYLAATLAEPGEEVPVGAALAILTKDAPARPVARAHAGTPAPAAPATEAERATLPVRAEEPTPHAAAPVLNGRILASPKARRLALEQGLDLNRLVTLGHKPPYHVGDLEVLRRQPPPSAAPLSITVQDGFTAFAHWAASSHGLTDPGAILAGFAGGALGRDICVAVASATEQATYAATNRLSAVVPSKAAPDLHLRDLRFGAVSAKIGGPELTLMKAGSSLAVSLGASGSLTEAEALQLLTGFAERLEDPLRHLL